MCDVKKTLINLWTLLLRSAERLSLLHNGWDLHWKTPKSGGWNHPKSCSRMRLAFDVGCQLGASVSLHRGLSMWLFWEGFFTAWCWGTRGKVPREGGPGGSWIIFTTPLRSHAASLPRHYTHRDNPEVLPRFKRRENRLHPLIGNGKILEEHVGPETLLWLLLNDATCHRELTMATSTVCEGTRDSRLGHQSSVLIHSVLSCSVFIYQTQTIKSTPEG